MGVTLQGCPVVGSIGGSPAQSCPLATLDPEGSSPLPFRPSEGHSHTLDTVTQAVYIAPGSGVVWPVQDGMMNVASMVLMALYELPCSIWGRITARQLRYVEFDPHRVVIRFPVFGTSAPGGNELFWS